MKILFILAAVLVSQASFAEKIKVTPMDGLPVPFANTNQRVELADNEVYGLFGYLQYNDKYGQMEFKPDFEVQPWLGTAARKNIGYYPMTRYAKNWHNFDGKYVKMIFRAKGKVYQGDYRASYVIWLDPISNPVESTKPVTKPIKK